MLQIRQKTLWNWCPGVALASRRCLACGFPSTHVQHRCNIRASYAQHRCKTRAPHMQRTCSIEVVHEHGPNLQANLPLFLPWEMFPIESEGAHPLAVVGTTLRPNSPANGSPWRSLLKNWVGMIGNVDTRSPGGFQCMLQLVCLWLLFLKNPVSNPSSVSSPARPPWPMWMQIASRMALSRKAWKAWKVTEAHRVMWQPQTQLLSQTAPRWQWSGGYADTTKPFPGQTSLAQRKYCIKRTYKVNKWMVMFQYKIIPFLESMCVTNWESHVHALGLCIQGITSNLYNPII